MAIVKYSEKHSDNCKSFKEAGKMQKGTTTGNKEAIRKDEEDRITAIDKRYGGTRSEIRLTMCEP